MPKLLHWSETVGCGITVKLDNGDEVIVSIAQSGVMVRLQARKGDGFLKRMAGGLAGTKLYNEAIPYKNAKACTALFEMYPNVAPELRALGLKNAALETFANAVWHCRNAAEVSILLNGAMEADISKKPKTAMVDVEETIARYGELIEKYPASYIDETWLPASKDQMRVAFKAVWQSAPELRNSVEVGWALLHIFQPGVGQMPICPTAPKDPRDKQGMARLERYLALDKKAETERKSDAAEMKAFIGNQNCSGRLTEVKADKCPITHALLTKAGAAKVGSIKGGTTALAEEIKTAIIMEALDIVSKAREVIGLKWEQPFVAGDPAPPHTKTVTTFGFFVTFHLFAYVRREIESETGGDNKELARGLKVQGKNAKFFIEFVDGLFLMGNSKDKSHVFMETYPQYEELLKSTVKNVSDWRAALNTTIWVYLKDPTSPTVRQKLGGFPAAFGELLDTLIKAED